MLTPSSFPSPPFFSPSLRRATRHTPFHHMKITIAFTSLATAIAASAYTTQRQDPCAAHCDYGKCLRRSADARKPECQECRACHAIVTKCAYWDCTEWCQKYESKFEAVYTASGCLDVTESTNPWGGRHQRNVRPALRGFVSDLAETCNCIWLH